MKVGIMTMQRIINYGSFLQAYGLKKTIESLGHEVEFVDYEVGLPLVELIDSSSNESKLKKVFKILFSKSYREKRCNEINQNKLFEIYYNEFRYNWLDILGVSSDMNYKPNLDILIVGSDEVFNCTQSNKDVGYSLQLFGKDNNANKLITYAASFGSSTIEELERYRKKEEIAEYLKKFDSISTRDSNSHEIVKELVGKDPFDHVDPVFIYDYSAEMDIKINIKDYIVVYAYSGRISDEEAIAIQDFAMRMGKKTISIGEVQSFTDMYINANPFEMLCYLKNSDYVITDTFHGTVFSIKFQIPFATIIRDSNRQKITDLLLKFDLTDRCINFLLDLDTVLNKELNKTAIKNKIEIFRKEAIDYLNNCLVVT